MTNLIALNEVMHVFVWTSGVPSFYFAWIHCAKVINLIRDDQPISLFYVFSLDLLCQNQPHVP